MKTTDLIPLILYELAEGDKYGFELSKSIETLSNGKIIIKQATLYTILKKLEKSKFISSYWQDSEIGGRRHYYKLTQNGNLQLSTMPRIEIVLENILQNSNLNDEEDDFSNHLDNSKPNTTENLPTNNSLNPYSINQEKSKETQSENKQQSIMDLLVNDESNKNDDTKKGEQSLKEDIIPTTEIFKSKEIDNLTENEINISNLDLLRNENEVNSEQFATNQNVTKFIETQPLTTYNNFVEQPKSKQKNDYLEPQTPKIDNGEIKFVDYVNFKQDPSYIKSNIVTKRMLLKILSSTTYLMLALIISAIVTNFTGTSILYYIFLIVGIIIAIFYPIIYLLNYEKFRLKCKTNGFKSDLKKHLIISISSFLLIFVSLIIINLSLGKNSITKLFEFNNFANLYAPVLISSFVIADLLFNIIFTTKILKKIKN